MERASAILLCAGFGTRLKPMTDYIPKPAIDFLGKPMVWYAMAALGRAGIKSFAANVHHLPEKMADTLGKCAENLGLPPVAVYHENGQILGTGGGARMCLELLPPSENYIIYHGDVLCGTDVSRALNAHIASGAQVTMVVAPRPPESKLGMVGIDKQSHVVRIRDWMPPNILHPEEISPCCFTGIHILRREILQSLPRLENTCLVTQVYPAMMNRSDPIHGHLVEDFFADIGTPDTYLDAQCRILRNPELLPLK